MNNDDILKERMDWELEAISLNKLNELGNRAVQLGLIAGHGHRGSKYELLRQGKAILLNPNEAIPYLENLIQEVGG